MPPQNDRESFNWLHFGNWLGPPMEDRAARSRRWKALCEDLALLHDESGPWDAIFMTGDIARSGTTNHYESVSEELRDLHEKLSELGSTPVVLTFPGPSDTQNSLPPAWDFLPEPTNYEFEFMYLLSWRQGALGDEFRAKVQSSFEPYDQWSRVTAPSRPEVFKRGILPGDFTATLALGTNRIGVAGLNTAIVQLSQGSVIRGRVPLDPRQLEEACGGSPDVWAAKHDLCLLMTHHSPSFLGPESRWGFYIVRAGRPDVARPGTAVQG